MNNKGASLSKNDIGKILDRLGYGDSVEISRNDLHELLRRYIHTRALDFVDVECEHCGETTYVEV